MRISPADFNAVPTDRNVLIYLIINRFIQYFIMQIRLLRHAIAGVCVCVLCLPSYRRMEEISRPPSNMISNNCSFSITRPLTTVAIKVNELRIQVRGIPFAVIRGKLIKITRMRSSANNKC